MNIDEMTAISLQAIFQPGRENDIGAAFLPSIMDNCSYLFIIYASLSVDGLFPASVGDQERAIHLFYVCSFCLRRLKFANCCCIVRIIFITRIVAKDKYYQPFFVFDRYVSMHGCT